MKVTFFGSLNRMVNSAFKPCVLCPFQLIISDGGDSLCSISFPRQSFDFRGEPGGLRVSNSLFLYWCIKVGYCQKRVFPHLPCSCRIVSGLGLSISSIMSQGTSAMPSRKQSGIKFLYCLDSMIRRNDLGHVSFLET